MSLKGDPEAEDAYARGAALRAGGRPAEAAAVFEAAVAAQPGNASYLFAYGLALGEIGRLGEAARALQSAAERAPSSAAVHLALGMAQHQLGDAEAAEAAYRRALDLDPGQVEAWSNLGLLLMRARGRQAEAEDCLGKALALDPGHDGALLNLGNLSKDRGRFEQARVLYRRSLAADHGSLKALGNLLLLDNYDPQADRAAGLALARRYGEICAASAGHPPRPERRKRPERLRVGMVSADLGRHPVGYFLEGVLAALASSGIEVVAYSTGLQEDDLTDRLRSSCAVWRSIAALSDGEAAAAIRADNIDVLLDLSGHTAGARLPIFAYRPAPVQASWLGYSNTTGLEAIDYFIGDRRNARSGDQPFFTESIWALPDTYLCFTPPEVDLPVLPPPCLGGGPIAFGCFNNPVKLNDAVVGLWGRVLQATPEARLLLKGDLYADPDFAAVTLSRFRAAGVAEGRIVLEGGSTRQAYLQAYNRVDIALDPFPFPGGTTTVEGFWMGVPVVALEGDRFLARAGGGFCRNLGLADWVASDLDDYVRIAVAKAGDRTGLAETRARLRSALLASPLCDASRFAGHFEAALRGMWAGDSPPALDP